MKKAKTASADLLERPTRSEVTWEEWLSTIQTPESSAPTASHSTDMPSEPVMDEAQTKPVEAQQASEDICESGACVECELAEPQQTFSVDEVTWNDINEPGAYVERGSGDLYRVPQEALIPGGSPVIQKQSIGLLGLVKISSNPFVTTLEARLRCTQHSIEPNF